MISSSCIPSQVLDLTNWYLTLPLANEKGDEAETVRQPELASFTHTTHFFTNDVQDAVVFSSFAGGFTTPNSKNTRSELREMNGKTLAKWNVSSGKHTMQYSGKVIKIPDVLPSVVIGQIHDGSDDVIEVRCWRPKENSGLVIDVFHDSKVYGVLDANYDLGKLYTIKIFAGQGKINVFYNDMDTPKIKISSKAKNCYFKVGCYLQNCKRIPAHEFAQVCVHDVMVKHESSAVKKELDIVCEKDECCACKCEL